MFGVRFGLRFGLRAPGIRGQLLAWVLLPLAGTVALDAWITRGNALDTASVVQDRLLMGAARMIAEQLRFEDGGVQQHIPPSALALFADPQGEPADAGADPAPTDRVYYRVSTRAGQMLAGYDDLSPPDAGLQPEAPHFFDTQVRAQPVRAVALWQPVLGEPHGQPVLVAVAQTLRGHDRLARSLWWRAVRQQLLILALATVLILIGLRRGLRPLLEIGRAHV